MNSIIKEMNLDENLAVVVINKVGNIIYVNHHFENLFNWERQEILNKSILTIIPPNMRDAHNIGFSRFMKTKKPTLLGKKLNLRAVKKNGQEFDACHYISSVTNEGELIFAANITEIIE